MYAKYFNFDSFSVLIFGPCLLRDQNPFHGIILIELNKSGNGCESMIEKTIQIFTEKEEEYVNLLSSIGTRKNIAKLLVYLGKKEEATSRDIEHGTDLRQPEVSVALRRLMERGWVRCHEVHVSAGRPVKVWNLAVPMGKILDCIGQEKQDELKARLDMVQRVRAFV
jgi:predicted transcriptional regulator